MSADTLQGEGTDSRRARRMAMLNTGDLTLLSLKTKLLGFFFMNVPYGMPFQREYIYVRSLRFVLLHFIQAMAAMTALSMRLGENQNISLSGRNLLVPC